MIGHSVLGSAQFQAWRAVLMADPCVYCGGTSTGMDHIQPRAAGGSNGWENRAPACAPCDNAKGAKPLVLFLLACHRSDRTAAGRRYETAAARAQARRLMRKQIIAEFYRWNVRFPDAPQAVSA